MMIKKNGNQRTSNKNYKKIEAMYRKGYSIDYICNATKESPITVICIMQRIFAMDHM